MAYTASVAEADACLVGIDAAMTGRGFRVGRSFRCECGQVETLVTLVGAIDHQSIEMMASSIPRGRPIILDVSRMDGAHSSVVAVCIRLARLAGEAVRLRGASASFLATLRLMNVLGFVIPEAGAS